MSIIQHKDVRGSRDFISPVHGHLPPGALLGGHGGERACCENKALEAGVKGQWDDSVKLVLILLAETIASREEVPASLLVHLPNVGLLGLGDGEEKVGHIFKHLI